MPTENDRPGQATHIPNPTPDELIEHYKKMAESRDAALKVWHRTAKTWRDFATRVRQNIASIGFGMTESQVIEKIHDDYWKTVAEDSVEGVKP